MKLVKADGCITNAKEERIRKHELHGGGLLDIGLYPIQFACLVYGEMPETITALGNITQTGMCSICLYLYMFNGMTNYGTVVASVCAYLLTGYINYGKLFSISARMWVSDKQCQSLVVFAK